MEQAKVRLFWKNGSRFGKIEIPQSKHLSQIAVFPVLNL